MQKKKKKFKSNIVRLNNWSIFFTLKSISPSNVVTEFILNAGMSEEATRQLYEQTPHLQPADISETLIHMLSAPPHVQVSSRLVLFTCVLVKISQKYLENSWVSYQSVNMLLPGVICIIQILPTSVINLWIPLLQFSVFILLGDRDSNAFTKLSPQIHDILIRATKENI